MHKVLLVGNPNTGKTTIFNSLTKLRHHTGNWAGKTVQCEMAKCIYRYKRFEIYDLPGTYCIQGLTDEEIIVKQEICENPNSLTVVVLDATCLERGLKLLFEVLEITRNVIVVVNLIDEAKRKKMIINRVGLSTALGVPVIFSSNKSKESIEKLKDYVYKFYDKNSSFNINPLSFSSDNKQLEYHTKAKEITAKYVHFEAKDVLFRDLLIKKPWNYIIMFFMIALVLFLTIKLSNYPSLLLEKAFNYINDKIYLLLFSLKINATFSNFICKGILDTVFTVIAVMLPPMAIFFPLFSFLEELGIFPRIAYNADYCFGKCGSSGKQALTMCMGFGCNASAVVGCRIIESPKQKLIAILTNSFIPCNGRFPLIILLSSVFFRHNFLIASLVVLVGILMTFFISFFLSRTILKEQNTEVTIEFPSYRMPNLKTILLRSLIDKTLVILIRAIVVAAPVGAIIWLLNNVRVDESNLLLQIASFLHHLAKNLGLDGVILLAFILALPANELVLPLIIMMYQLTSVSSSTSDLLIENFWTIKTALCTMLFSVLHAPCSTTLLTIYKETKSVKWTILGFIIPTITAITVCFLVNLCF